MAYERMMSMNRIKYTLGLLSSMINAGENHTEHSLFLFERSVKEVDSLILALKDLIAMNCDKCHQDSDCDGCTIPKYIASLLNGRDDET
jgi:hypothetical protein